MGAPDLLHQLRGVGLVLTLTPAGELHVGPRDVLNDDRRAAIRAERHALVQALHAESLWSLVHRRSGNPLMTQEQGDACHAGCWNEAEIEAFTTREEHFSRLGHAADSEHLAERLTLRDREGDDRRLCLECLELNHAGYCLAARRGVLPGADRRCQPIVSLLMRCPAFVLAQ